MQKYATSEDVPIIFKWLTKESNWCKVNFLEHHSDCAKLILAKNYKFFTDVFLDAISGMSEFRRTILSNCGLTDIHQHVIYNQLNINYKLFTDNRPDDFILYVLFKRNDIKSFCILKCNYSDIHFDIDGSGTVISYSTNHV